MEKIRPKMLALIKEKEGKNRKSECNKIRASIRRYFDDPKDMWHETSKGRKVYRKVYSAVEQTTVEGIEMRIEETDKIWGHKNW